MCHWFQEQRKHSANYRNHRHASSPSLVWISNSDYLTGFHILNVANISNHCFTQSFLHILSKPQEQIFIIPHEDPGALDKVCLLKVSCYCLFCVVFIEIICLCLVLFCFIKFHKADASFYHSLCLIINSD